MTTTDMYRAMVEEKETQAKNSSIPNRLNFDYW